MPTNLPRARGADDDKCIPRDCSASIFFSQPFFPRPVQIYYTHIRDPTPFTSLIVHLAHTHTHAHTHIPIRI